MSDAWRDTYDAWKLRSPEDEYPEAECYHEEYEIDWEGRAHCDRCGEAWWPGADEVRSQREASRAYDEHCRREERRERWRRLTWWVRWPIFRLLDKAWPRRSLSVLHDDEIPF